MEFKMSLNEQVFNNHQINVIMDTMMKLSNYFDELFFEKYTSSQIDLITFNKFKYLVEAFDNINGSTGFSEHIQEYKNDFESTFLVTVVANRLVLSGYNVTLEPTIEGISKKPDICFEFSENNVYFECKRPVQDPYEYMNHELHNKIFDIICKYIKVPCDIQIEYDNETLVSDIENLGPYLDKHLALVKDEGLIYSHNGLKISVTDVREKFVERPVCSFTFMIQDFHSNGLFPLEVICRNNISMGFVKKDIDKIRKTIITGQLKRASKKVNEDQPIILVIDGNTLPGSKVSNEEYISSLFKPDKFTSFNGVLLLYPNFGLENSPSINSQFITNPYAKNPIKNILNEFRLNIFKETY